MNWKFWKTNNSTLDGNYVANNQVQNRVITDVYDGEKTPGELGDVYDTTPDHIKLRLRSYDLQLKTDLVGIISGKFFKWILGSGLKMQAEPNKNVLSMFGIDADLKKFQKDTESLFNLYSNSKYSDYQKNDWFHEKANEGLVSAFLGGDALCVLRVDDFGVNMQVIDGQHIETPDDGNDILNKKKSGNIIKHGVELDKRGTHVAFYVVLNDDEEFSIDRKYERIESVNSRGLTMAWMIYGTKHRIDSVRGIPFISSIMEKVSKLDRYSEASVSKAEQTANLIYTIEHDKDSTGENPITNFGSKKSKDGEVNEISDYEKAGRTAQQIKQSTSNQVYNMPQGASVKSFSGEAETKYPEFFKAIFYSLCASVDIPPEVALQYYEQNYSSSRAAINSWEHIVEVYRKKFAKKFYHNFYRVFLEHEILMGNIEAPGYLQARSSGKFMVIEAYVNARFIGKKMPHIDPLKEAKAVRNMLGDDNTALISREQAVEILGQGEWNENFTKSIEEENLIPKEENDTKDTED